MKQGGKRVLGELTKADNKMGSNVLHEDSSSKLEVLS